MAKYRIHLKKESPVIVKRKLSRKEKVSERELEELSLNPIAGLFQVSYDGKRLLTYQAPPSVSLGTYLKEHRLNETSFWQITAGIIDLAIEIENRGLYLSHLLIRMDMVFIREDTLEMYVIYQPVVSKAVSAELSALLQDIIYSALKSGDRTAQNYLAAFKGFLEQENASLVLIRQYINKAAPWTAADSKVQDPGSIVQQHIDYDIDPAESLDQDTYTMVLDGEEEGNAVAVKKGILLTRLRENEQTALYGSRLCLGRSVDCDYSIAGNGAIGRRHALLERLEDGYYLKDMDSVNGTFLNEQAVEGEQRYKLQDGDRIRLADEEFIVKFE